MKKLLAPRKPISQAVRPIKDISTKIALERVCANWKHTDSDIRRIETCRAASIQNAGDRRTVQTLKHLDCVIFGSRNRV